MDSVASMRIGRSAHTDDQRIALAGAVDAASASVRNRRAGDPDPIDLLRALVGVANVSAGVLELEVPLLEQGAYFGQFKER